jgi:hypothetical protein
MPIRTPLRITSDTNIENTPDERGVYGLYGAGRNLIYYGAAESSIRDGLKGYLAGNSNSFTEAACYFNYELSDYPFLREKELLAEQQKSKMKFPERNIQISSADMGADNYLQMFPFQALFHLLGKISHYFGVYSESR